MLLVLVEGQSASSQSAYIHRLPLVSSLTPQRLSHLNAAACGWHTLEVLSCNCVAQSSCGEVASGRSPVPHQNYQLRGEWGEVKRGGGTIKMQNCHRTVVRHPARSLLLRGSHLMMEQACVWWCVNACPFVWMCAHLHYMSVFDRV